MRRARLGSWSTASSCRSPKFYSANLSQEIHKGLNQKAREGGWPTLAPYGYKNIRLEVSPGQRCDARLSSLTAKRRYVYFYCLGAHNRRTDCEEPYTRTEDLEADTAATYSQIELTPAEAADIAAKSKSEIERRSSDQELLAEEHADTQLNMTAQQLDESRQLVRAAVKLAMSCGADYTQADDRARRCYNQARRSSTGFLSTTLRWSHTN